MTPNRQDDNYETSHSVAAALAELKVRMKTVEAWVEESREFRDNANEFFTTFKANEINKTRTDGKRASVHFWLLSILIAVIGALATALFEGHHL